MVKQKKRTCTMQSGKKYAINCAIQGVRLIWKQKIWLAICKFLWSFTNQNAWFVSSFCTELTLFCTAFEKNCAALNQSKWRNFFKYIINDTNILLIWRSRPISRFKRRRRCHSFMALNGTSDVLAADWTSQTQVKNYRNFSCVVIRLFSVVEIPIKHFSLYNKKQYFIA